MIVTTSLHEEMSSSVRFQAVDASTLRVIAVILCTLYLPTRYVENFRADAHRKSTVTIVFEISGPNISTGGALI
jgi:hypothetical protein